MKLNVKKFSILGLIGIFLLSAMLCCCITKTVQAEEPTPSCHQTAQEANSSNNSAECNCDQFSAVIKKDIKINDTFASLTIFFIEHQSENHFLSSPIVVAYQAPVQFYDTSPLYIKHSSLRI